MMPVATVPLKYSSGVELRLDEAGHTLVYAPYCLDFIVDLKLTFCSPEALAGAIGPDRGAEWDQVLQCWRIYTGWTGCEDWLDKLIELLNRHYPQ